MTKANPKACELLGAMHREERRVCADGISASSSLKLQILLIGALIGSSECYAGHPQPPLLTQLALDQNFQQFQIIKSLCGSYPKEDPKKELAALKAKDSCGDPDKINGAIVVLTRFSEDGYRQPLSYVSDGTHFRIEASHDYYVTDQSNMQKDGKYWDHPDGGITPPPGRFHTWAEFLGYFGLFVLGLGLVLGRKYFKKYWFVAAGLGAIGIYVGGIWLFSGLS